MSTLKSSSGFGTAYVPPNSTNLKAWYPMYEQTDPLLDRSSNDNDMDVIEGAAANAQGYGAGRAQYEAAAANCAFGHSGTIADLDINDASTNVLISFRANIAAGAAGNGSVLGKATNSISDGYHVRLGSGYINLLEGDTNIVVSTAHDHNDGVDHHAAIIMDRTGTGNASLYVDSVADGSGLITAVTGDLSTYPFTIGGVGKSGTVTQNLDGLGVVQQVWDIQVYMTTSALPSNIVTLAAWLDANEYKALSTEQW